MKMSAYTEADGFLVKVTVDASGATHDSPTSMKEHHPRFWWLSSLHTIPIGVDGKATYKPNLVEKAIYDSVAYPVTIGQMLSSLELSVSTVQKDTSLYQKITPMSSSITTQHVYTYAGANNDMEVPTGISHLFNRKMYKDDQLGGNVFPQSIFYYPTIPESISENLDVSSETSTVQGQISGMESASSVIDKNFRMKKASHRWHYMTKATYENIKVTHQGSVYVLSNKGFESSTGNMQVRYITNSVIQKDSKSLLSSQVYMVKSSQYTTLVEKNQNEAFAQEGIEFTSNEIQMVMHGIYFIFA